MNFEKKDVLMSEVLGEVEGNILPYWMNKTVDKLNGGFIGEIDCNENAINTAPKGIVLNARILWTFSRAYLILKEKKYLVMADRAYNYIVNNFIDHDLGGAYWLLDSSGKALNSQKKIYGQAFTLYGLSEYYRASNKEESLKQAIDIFNKIEKYSYDAQNFGYFEAYTKEWKLEEDLKLSEIDMNEKKSMNTNLHVMEAYTSLYRVWKDEELKLRLTELVKVILEKVLDTSNYHFKLFFDEFWNSQSTHISYGHDIEGSWLLVKAAETLEDKELIKVTKDTAIKIAEAVYNDGLDEDGSVFYESDGTKIIDSNKHWWPQAEAVIGFLNAYDISQNEKYLEEALKAWKFIKEKIVDHKNGEWFSKISKQGEVYKNLPKVDMWKCPYHNSRQCFELIERLN